jgi:folate-binding Fe-S cluster repair protein YgfZ
MLFESFIYKLDDAYLIETKTKDLDNLKRHLTMYKIRNKVNLDIIDDVIAVQSNYPLSDSLLSIKDPRHNDLGFRNIAKSTAIDTTDSTKYKPLDEYKLQRILLGIPETVLSGETLPLEWKLDKLNGGTLNNVTYQ